MAKENVIDRLRAIFATLSPKLQRLATYIIDNHKDVAFLNVGALAKAAGVSETTVTRLSYALGFQGFSDFRQALQRHMKSYVSLPKYEPSRAKGFILAEVAAMEKTIIDEMLTHIPPEMFKQVVDRLHRAKNVIIVGTHYNAMPALYAAHFLSAIRPRVSLVHNLNVDAYAKARAAGDKDVVLAISTARYPKETQEILTDFHSKGIRIISITDSEVSPVAPLSDIALLVPMKFMSFIDPYSGIMTLIHALVNAVLVAGGEASRKWLENYNMFMEKKDFHTVKGLKVIDLFR
ncbi:MurR/RpiR family transcriptional regulator [Deltaproteobacteria bacterium OttesenSCG-928-M10]|nr:MurR/RpiR family transcriptional regulator [Deltaproteobacteria bacterium OttesenSCG-928-M10]